ncbi:hypothetical protein D9M70_389850 [compost metagenome]
MSRSDQWDLRISVSCFVQYQLLTTRLGAREPADLALPYILSGVASAGVEESLCAPRSR